jgi:Zn-dependent peptidase ImmA (M78 family)
MVEPQCIPGVTTDTITHLLGSAAQSWSAVTITAEDCRIIVYNPTHSSARLESDIMHELAHFIRNHVPSSFHQLPGLPFPLREYRKLDEDEAQWLGGCLQIPRAALLLVLRNGVMQDSELAVHFNASIEMVRYRRNATGVDQQLKNAARYIRRSN